MEYLKQTTLMTGEEPKVYWHPVQVSREKLKQGLIANGMPSLAAMDLKRDGKVQLTFNDGTITFELTPTKE